MKKSRFTESQIVSILREGEAGVPVADLARKHGISRTTYFNWRSKCAGVSVSELKRIKELEAENAKLKRMWADLALENAAIKELGSPSIMDPVSKLAFLGEAAGDEMKRKQFTEEQIIGILKEAEASGSIREVCRLHNVTETTFYRWRSRPSL